MQLTDFKIGDIVRFKSESDWPDNYRALNNRLFRVVRIDKWIGILPLVKNRPGEKDLAWFDKPDGGGFFPNDLEKLN